VILVPKNIFLLKILNFMQSFVECKVSLADGNHVDFATDATMQERNSRVGAIDYQCDDWNKIVELGRHLGIIAS
jgi:hypothetical protein